MHELSVAQSIIDIIKENVPEKDYGKVNAVLLEVGEFSGIIADSLQFCYDAVKLETPFHNSRMEIKKVPFVLYCNLCKVETTNSNGIRMCEKCGGFDNSIVSGTEMRVTEVELD
jgi:hydrogenase nickel incorporation protein HypA/HybF